MCGIAGFIDFESRTTPATLASMTAVLSHRGPDGFGVDTFTTSTCQIGLGQRRLAIIDVSENGKQPMHYQHLSIVFNGEIYNFRELKNELIQLQHQFVTHSDTEVLLHAYWQWGQEAFKKCIGMFAIVIYDQKKQELIGVRDRAGIKPFYYYWHNHLFLFGSELKALLQHPNFEKEINTDAVAAFLQFGNVPGSHCIYKHCFKLLPASILKVSLAQKHLQTEVYWNVYDAYNAPKLTLSFTEALQQTETLLESAFNYRLVADVPIGVFLSGGYDSAAVTCLLQKNRSEKLKTFTIAIPDSGLNEAPYAKAVATHLNTDHHELMCTTQEAIDLISYLPFYYDEPFADSSAIPTLLVSKMARQHVTVALSADGGDEVFAGYNRYDYMIRFGKRLKTIPPFMRASAASLLKAVPAHRIPVLKNRYNFHNRYEKLKGLLNDASSENLMLSLTQQYTTEGLQQLMNVPFNAMPNAYSSKALKADYYSDLAYLMAIDYQTYLPDDILQKVDRASMAFSLEAREPFLDHRIIEWAAQLPDAFKYYKGEKKYILKTLVHQYIPKTLMDRPKMGFAIPIDNWLCGPLKSYVLHYLNAKALNHHGFFNTTEVIHQRDAFLNGKRELAQKIWYLLMFQMWFNQWIEKLET